MSSEIKILLTSDVHLGIKNDDILIPEKVRINTFKKITTLANEHDILLIGGDLIDNNNVDNTIVELIKSEFEKLRNNNIEIIYTPGIGELDENGAIIPLISEFNVSNIFSDPICSSPYAYTKDDQQIYFYGVPASSKSDISKIKKSSAQGFHIGLFHVEFDLQKDESKSTVFRLQKHTIKTLDLDFYAFGYNHNFKMFKVFDKIIGAYPGSPEATSFNENGDRYVLSIAVKDNEISQIKRLLVNSMKLSDIKIDCSNIDTQEAILELIEKNKSIKTIQKIFLTGIRNFTLDENEILKYKNEFYHLELIDKSIPSLSVLIKEYEYEDSVRGEFYKILKERLDQWKIHDEIDLTDLAVSLHKITKSGFDTLEDWLCNL